MKAEQEIKAVLTDYVEAARGMGPFGDVSGIVDALFSKLTKMDMLNPRKVPVYDLKDVPKVLSDGTACEVDDG